LIQKNEAKKIKTMPASLKKLALKIVLLNHS